MSRPDPKPQLAKLATLLAMARNSAGTKLFRTAIYETDGKERDFTEGGVLSCGFHVSSILYILGLIGKPHLTVQRTIEDMTRHGWQAVTGRKQPGDVLAWEPVRIGGEANRHMGFYIGNGWAVSTSYKRRVVIKHKADAAGRKIETVLRYSGE